MVRFAPPAVRRDSGIIAASVFDGPAEEPRKTIRFTPPAVTGDTITVAPADDLQTKINSASPGDEVVLDPAGDWNGPITLPARSDLGWITIRGDVSLPAFGSRIGTTPALPTVTMTTDVGIDIPGTTGGWWLQGIEIVAGTGAFANAVQTAIGTTRVVLDRFRVTGTATEEIQLGFLMKGSYLMMIGSRFAGIRRATTNSRGVEILEGPGPFRVHNSFIEAASINFIAGNANPDKLANDIEFTKNHCYKRPSWISVADLNVKNHYETKMGLRILAEGCVFENVWADAQTGRSIILSSRELSGETAPINDGTDHILRLCKVLNSPQIISISRNPEGDPGPLRRVVVRDLICEDWGKDSPHYVDENSRLLQINRGVDDLVFKRITALSTAENQTAIDYGDADPDPKGVGVTWESLAIGPTTNGLRGAAGGSLDQTYESTPRTFSDLYLVENGSGACPDGTGDPDVAAALTCVASAGDIPDGVGADEDAVNTAISGVRDDELPS